MINTKKTKTREKISRSFLNLIMNKNINQISIKEITTNCGVSSPTFYNNFKDINHLLNYIFYQANLPLYSAIEKDFKNNESDFIIHDIVNITYEQRDTIKVLFNKNLYGFWKQFLIETYSPLIYEYLFKNGKIKKNGVNEKETSEIFIRVVIDNIQLWITKSVPEEPKLFKTKLIAILFNPFISTVYSTQK